MPGEALHQIDSPATRREEPNTVLNCKLIAFNQIHHVEKNMPRSMDCSFEELMLLNELFKERLAGIKELEDGPDESGANRKGLKFTVV